MKRLIIVDVFLIILACLIPDVKVESVQVSEQVNVQIEENIQVSSRSLEEPRKEVVQKSTEVIQKCTELTTESNLRQLSNLTIEEYELMLENTNLKGLGSTLVEIENTYHINGLYMLGLSALESSFGNSNIAKTKNNITGYCAYDRNTSKATKFDSYRDCLIATAKLLDKYYLTENACYFNGYSAKAIDVKYCTDREHANKIIKIVNELIKKLED